VFDIGDRIPIPQRASAPAKMRSRSVPEAYRIPIPQRAIASLFSSECDRTNTLHPDA
jgi:hypothetical protein